MGISRAIRAGYRLVDILERLRHAAPVGEAVRRSEVPREELYVVTKVEEDDGAREAAHAYMRQMGSTTPTSC